MAPPPKDGIMGRAVNRPAPLYPSERLREVGLVELGSPPGTTRAPAARARRGVEKGRFRRGSQPGPAAPGRPISAPFRRPDRSRPRIRVGDPTAIVRSPTMTQVVDRQPVHAAGFPAAQTPKHRTVSSGPERPTAVGAISSVDGLVTHRTTAADIVFPIQPADDTLLAAMTRSLGTRLIVADRRWSDGKSLLMAQSACPEERLWTIGRR